MSTNHTPGSLRLHSLEITNYKKIVSRRIEPKGRHVIVSGRNSSGKSSFVGVVWDILGAYSAKNTPEPIRHGEKSASAVLYLCDPNDPETILYRAERRWTPSSIKIGVYDGEGRKLPSDVTKDFIGTYSLNPTAFLAGRPQDQLDDVLAVAGIAPPVEAVQAITGVAHPAKQGESSDTYLARLSADETGLYYQQRHERGRVADQKKKALEEQTAIVNSLGGPLLANEPESVAGMLVRMEELQQAAKVRLDVSAVAGQVDNELDICKSRLADLLRERQTLAGQIEEARKHLTQLEAKQIEIDGRITKGQGILAEVVADAERANAHLESLPDPTEQIATLRHNLSKVESSNNARSKRVHATEQLNRIGGEHVSAIAEHKRVDDLLELLRDLRRHQLDDVDFGVPGLSVGDGELLYHDISFVQAGTAEKLRVACAIAMMGNPRLRLLRLDDMEHLDDESLALLYEFADAHDFEILGAVVAKGDLTIEIVDGAEAAVEDELFPAEEAR